MRKRLKQYLYKVFSSRIKTLTWSHFYHADRDALAGFKQLHPEINIAKITPLCTLMNKNGSDKGIGWHNYSRFYHHAFQNLKIENLFELGIGSTNSKYGNNMGAKGKPGASLKAWKSYLPSAKIFGADIDPDTVFSEDRIETFVCDQTNIESIAAMWSQPSVPKSFEVIIDDGLHQFDANKTFFEASIQKLSPGGIYVVEDIQNVELGLWKQLIENDYVSRYPNLIFRLCSLPNLFNALDNNLLVIYSNR